MLYGISITYASSIPMKDFGFFFAFFFFDVGIALAACDVRRNSPTLDWGLNPEVPPENGLPPEEPVEPLPEIPRLNQPLIPENTRREQLRERLSFHFMGGHDREHLPLFLGILEKQLDIETKVEAALVYDGYDPRRILANMPEIRGVLFNHPTRGMALSELSIFERDQRKWDTS